MIRNFFAGILLLTATLYTLVGLVLQWTNHMATSPGPTQQLAQTITRDEVVKGVVMDLLRSSVEQWIPESVNQIPGLRTKLEEATDTRVSTMMSSPGIQSAWGSMLNDNRETLLKDLTEHSSGRIRILSSVKVNLDPLISRMWQVVRSNVDPKTSTHMDQLETPAGIQIKVAGIPAQQADQANQALVLVSYWWLFRMAAGLLLVGGLPLETRINCWVLLAVFATVGLGAVTLIHDLGEFVTFPNSGNQLVWTIETQIIRQLSSSLSS